MKETELVDNKNNAPFDSESDDMPNVEEALKCVPDGAREVIERFMAVQQIRYSETSADMEIASKITPEHITEILSGSRENMQRGYKEKNSKRWFAFAILLVAVVALILVIVLLKNQPEVMEGIVKSLTALVAGALGGFGAGYVKGKKDD